jgi:general secretion pathway protein K
MSVMRRPDRQHGIALVLTLWLTVLLTAIAGGFAYSMHVEAVAAGNAVGVAKVRAAADGAIERAVYELQRPRVPGAWVPNGAPHAWQDGEIEIVARATDETAKIDLNAANEVLLRGLFTAVGGADPDTAVRLVDAVIDWRDPDDFRRPNGAEASDYQAAGAKILPANAPFETIGEVSRVLGMTPAIYGRIAGSVTVFSRQAGINPLTASRDVLLALPNADAAAVDAYVAARDEALRAGQPPPPYVGAAGFTAGAIQTWRIRAEARLPDGVTFVREAVARPSPDPARPLVVLAWLEGASAPPAAADAGSENNDAARP